MFLATTADQRFWNKETEILFLGAWCHGDQRMLPYHWDDRARLYRDSIYVKNIYEKHLVFLSDRMNALHDIEHSLRFWRIVLGPWLHYFIEILYDRYLSIKGAEESQLVTDTWLLNCDSRKLAPVDFAGFQCAYDCDVYNLFLYGEIIRFTGNLPYTDSTIIPEYTWLAEKRESGFKGGVKKLAGNIFSLVPDRFNKNIFVASYLGSTDLVKLQLQMGQLPYLHAPEINLPREEISTDMREKLIYSFPDNDEFGSLLCTLIPWQVPCVHVELFERLGVQVKKKFPKSPSSIMTANAHVYHEAFKLWAAHNIEKGSRLFIAQHGGHYGTGLWNSEEDHEIAIADLYLSWGWTDDKKNIVPISSGKLAKAIKKIRADPDGKIMWVTMCLPRYAYFMYSIPVGPQYLSYLEDQFAFAQELNEQLRNQIVLRLHPCDFGWNQKKRWQQKFPDLTIEDGSMPFYEQLNRSRLLVTTYNATTYLETFAANYPTVMFWNDKHWELRASAMPYFRTLEEVGILHNTPQSAAVFVEKIAGNPASWWMSREVQDVREKFVKNYARVSNDYLKELKKIITGPSL